MIHPTSVVHHTAVIGKHTYIGPFCVIGPNVTIGSNNRLMAHVCIGLPAQWRGKESKGTVRIGNNNVFHERTSVHAAPEKGESTIVEDDCYVMAGSVINHDCWIETGVTISGNVNVSGHCRVMAGANIGMNAVIHQKQVIGSYAMVAMGAVVTKTAVVEPGSVFAGNPARFMKKNVVGLNRANVTLENLEEETRRFEALRHD